MSEQPRPGGSGSSPGRWGTGSVEGATPGSGGPGGRGGARLPPPAGGC